MVRSNQTPIAMHQYANRENKYSELHRGNGTHALQLNKLNSYVQHLGHGFDIEYCKKFYRLIISINMILVILSLRLIFFLGFFQKILL